MPVRRVRLTCTDARWYVPSALYMEHMRGSILWYRSRAASMRDAGEACSPAAHRWNPIADVRLFRRESPFFADALTSARWRPDNSARDDGQGRP